VPPEVIDRAKEVLRSLERNGARAGTDLVNLDSAIPATKKRLQLTLFELEKHPALEELESLDVTSLTPVEAMMKLDELQRKARS
jgi:DNA mismatch repair protein MutS